MTLRRLTAWLVAASLMFAGTFVTHCYVFAQLSTAHHGAHGGSTSLVGFLCAAPFLLSCVTLLAAGLVARGFVGGKGARLSVWPFGVLAPVGFLLHQYFLGFTGTAAPSLTSAAFLVGLALQVPLGLLAYFAARGLLRVADRIGAILTARRAGRARADRAPARRSAVPDHPLAVLLAGAGAARAPPLAVS